ncbi:AEC family transporter [Rhodobacteraceae bacterium F11138]|nr:AEC family transporter [Rhodobacteraceae bacterium F11138]
MFQTLIDVILPVFLVIGAGYATTRARYFDQSQISALMRFAQSFAIPCLLLRAIAHTDLSTGFDPALLISFYTGASLCFILGVLAARILFRRDWEDSIAIGFCCLFSNTILMGLPITERAYGPDSLTGNYAIIAFHAPFCYGVGITAMEIVRNRGNGGFKTARATLTAMFRNTMILGILLGFLINISGLSIPSAVDDALVMISRAALPCALFALGGVLVQYRPEGDMRIIFFICSLSLLIYPATVWAIAGAADLPQNLFRSAVLNAAMAPGINAYIFANMYARATRVTASSVLIATAFSVLTTWLWLTLLG